MDDFSISTASDELTGSVKWYSIERAYGFVIDDETGEEALLHENTLRDYGLSHVPEKSRVHAVFEKNEKGLQIKKVLEIVLPEGASLTKLGEANIEAFDPDEFQPARVKWFDQGRGYGFVNLHQDESDYFLHVEVLRNSGLAKVTTGEALSVVITNAERGAVVQAIGPWNDA